MKTTTYWTPVVLNVIIIFLNNYTYYLVIHYYILSTVEKVLFLNCFLTQIRLAILPY